MESRSRHHHHHHWHVIPDWYDRRMWLFLLVMAFCIGVMAGFFLVYVGSMTGILPDIPTNCW